MRKIALLSCVAALAGVVISPSFAATTKTVKGTKSDRWSPASLTVKPGDKIRFTWNNTGAPHNVRKTSGKGGRVSNAKISDKGAATFTVPRSARKGAKYRFVCDVHVSTMKLTATVR